MVIFVAPVSHCVELALFAVDFSGKFPKYVAAVPHLHSIHPSITRESKWRYIMKKINLRELYPDVYTTDFCPHTRFAGQKNNLYNGKG